MKNTNKLILAIGSLLMGTINTVKPLRWVGLDRVNDNQVNKILSIEGIFGNIENFLCIVPGVHCKYYPENFQSVYHIILSAQTKIELALKSIYLQIPEETPFY